MNATPLIIVSLIVIGIGAYWFLAPEGTQESVMTESDSTEMMEKEENAMMEKDDAMETDSMMPKDELMEGEVMMQKEDSMMKDEAMMQTGSYEAYDSAKLAKANDGDVVLFFRASWCPTCRALDADIKENLKDIPADVTILDVNYDTATELRKKYGVTMQHTLVQVAADGTLLSKWSGGNTLQSLLGELI